MAEPFLGLALNGVTPLVNNYERAWVPVKSKAQKMRERRRGGRGKHDDYDDEPTPEDRGWVLKKRSEVKSDEEIVERVPRRQQMVPYRPNMDRRASSLDGNDYRDRREGRNDRRVGTYRGHHDASDSEGSVPPRSRVSRARSRRSSSKSTSSSEDLGSSTDDQRRCRDINRKKWLTGSLAAVATVHAAAKIYSSLEKRDVRHAKVLAGELSPEDARKARNKGRVQDAAAVGVAALGIRGAMGEWHEVEEKAEQHKKILKQREENHRKRMERQKRWRERQLNGRGSGYDDDRDRDDGSYRQRAIKDHGEYDRHRSKSMSTYDDDQDSRALVRSKSRRRSDD
jgi:hypothetical protein